MTARDPRRALSTAASDMASERGEKAPITASVQPIGVWEPPSEDLRALVRDGLERNGAFDLVEILGLREAA